MLAWLVLTLGTVSLATTAGVCIYHLALMVVAVGCRHGARRGYDRSSHSFAIVIPAHNEEASILRTLDSCAALDYPEAKRAVYVIADNCSDRTAELAGSRGATCLVRCDEEKRGKGCALAWAFPTVLAAGCDAVVVLDADCRLDPRALRVFDERLRGGDRVLQASDVVANPDDNPTCYALALANVLENQGFYAPKSAVGLAVFLRGTGMVFHREVLLQFPWQAESIVEDAQYTCQLLEAGESIHFVSDVVVASDFPVRRDQLAVQRARWIGGGLRMAAVYVPRLVCAGLRTRRFVLLDAALTLLVISRPLVIGQFLFSLALIALCQWVSSGQWATMLAAISLSVAVAYAVYAAVGVALLGIGPKRVRLLAQLPLSIVAYLFIALTGVARCNATRWERTPRIDHLAEIKSIPSQE